jgi:hypothetical protein
MVDPGGPPAGGRASSCCSAPDAPTAPIRSTRSRVCSPRAVVVRPTSRRSSPSRSSRRSSACSKVSSPRPRATSVSTVPIGSAPRWSRGRSTRVSSTSSSGSSSAVRRGPQSAPGRHPTYAAHLSVLGLYERLMSDAGAHPESMHQRYGAYGALVSLFRAVYFGVRHAHAEHGDLHLPPRQGRLFDPSAFPFLEGGMPGRTAAVSLPEDRAAVRLPTDRRRHAARGAAPADRPRRSAHQLPRPRRSSRSARSTSR